MNTVTVSFNTTVIWDEWLKCLSKKELTKMIHWKKTAVSEDHKDWTGGCLSLSVELIKVCCQIDIVYLNLQQH